MAYLLDALRMQGHPPSLTVHHFASPVWVDDPGAAGLRDAHRRRPLPGWGHRRGAPRSSRDPRARGAARPHLRRPHRRVATVNEPINFLPRELSVGGVPARRSLLFTDTDRFIDVIRNYIRAHRRHLRGHQGQRHGGRRHDGNPPRWASRSVADWIPTRNRAPQRDPADVAARDRVRYVYHSSFRRRGARRALDANLDGVPERCTRSGAATSTGSASSTTSARACRRCQIIPRVRANVCLPNINLGACVPPADPTHQVLAMGYEFWAPGLYNVLRDFGRRYADLPLTVTESGLATEVGARRCGRSSSARSRWNGPAATASTSAATTTGA